ncbi:hypothetical protein COV04_01845 [Candidatus Uhrbacteria bacterium CG10_big_fil_rev_8_21_14_0_10_48_11]|uniref:Uncharacterized protein n=1 Tax=Candidatus Uhrbacteria bacterium CG10_big_fil_rev_8_21_14_0_10_48_11 TaxID=1975037 RepID=A0A2M8LF56_9BACT|nr:MAG: hypothetical protein COV04_01845 [Candidatus Uhrbacteria bacterium CG10_big_fil_rev_8_21_14_0_10_48_11]
MKHFSITATLALFLAIFIGFTIPVQSTSASVTYGICTCADGNSSPTTQTDCTAHTCAQNSPCCSFVADPPQSNTGQDPAPSNTGNGTGTTVTLKNPLGSTPDAADIRVLIGRIIRVALSFVGSLALIIVVYGGLTWMTSYGNAGRVKQGRDTLIWAALGLVVILTSYVVVDFLIKGITTVGT